MTKDSIDLTLPSGVLLNYEAASSGPRTRCPIHSLAHDYTELARGLNLALIRAFVDGVDGPALDAILDPGPDSAVVQLVES